MTKAAENAEFYRGVTEAFGFLRDRYNFVLSATEEGVVKFAKGDLRLEVYREPMSFMIYVQVSFNSTGEIFVLHEILKVLVPEKGLTAQCGGRDVASMLNCLNQLSLICQQDLHAIFEGDQDAFQKVASSVQKDRESLTLECRFGPTRDRANLAWVRRQWNVARELYEEALPILSLAEKRRLDFLVHRDLPHGEY